MTTKNGAIAPNGIGLPAKSLTADEILQFCLEQIRSTSTVQDWEMQSYMAIGRMDALVLAGVIPHQNGKELAALIFDKASDQLLYVMEAECGRN